MIPGIMAGQVRAVMAGGGIIAINEVSTMFRALMDGAYNPPIWDATINSTSGVFSAPTLGALSVASYSGVSAIDATGLTIASPIIVDTWQTWGLTSLWFKTTSADAMGLISHGCSAYNRYLKVYVSGGAIGVEAKNYTVIRTIGSGGGYNDGVWHHVCAMYSPNAADGGYIYLFVDNILIGLVAFGSSGDATGGFKNITIGYDIYPFTGSIARIRICNLKTNTSLCGADSANRAQLDELYNEMAAIWRP